MTTAYDPHADWRREDRELAPRIPVGALVHIVQPWGDAYRGFISDLTGNVVTLVDYTACYADASGPYSPRHSDESVSVRVTDETSIERDA